MTAIRTLMAKDMVTIEPDATVLEAATRMRANRVGAILIVERNAFVGLFSERDLVNRVVAQGRDPQLTKVGEVGTRDVEAIEVDQPLRNVLDVFRAGRFRHLPVLENGKPVGILSTRDFLAFLVDGLERHIDDLTYRRELAKGIDPYDHLGGSYDR